MNYSKWISKKEMKENLEEFHLDKKEKITGVPLLYEENTLYISTKDSHNLIIGSTGSGKTQGIILPEIKLSINKKESLIINDPKKDIYERVARQCKKEGYEIVVIDLEDTRNGNHWNPLSLPYSLYQEGNKDKAIDIIDDLGYYLFEEPNNKELDPFWTNSVINYFTGIVLYLFEKGKEEEINLSSVESLSNTIMMDKKDSFLKEIEKNKTIYRKISSILKSPSDTRGSILSVFNQKISKYITKSNLEELLSKSDYKMDDILLKPTIVFIVSGLEEISYNLIPLYVNQIISLASTKKEYSQKVNILLDKFDYFLPIKNFSSILAYSRSLKIRLTVAVQSFIHLQNMYSKEEVEILKMCFGNLIYLLSDDIYTLEEISKYCGEREIDGKILPLITKEELKTLKPFEAIVMMSRNHPFKTELLPDYKINWEFEEEKETLELRKQEEIKIFEYKEWKKL